MENFVRDYGTGNQIPDPPAFVNYQTADAIPSSSARPTSRVANFNRSSSRELPARQYSYPPVDETPIVNTAGIGAGGGAQRADSYNQEQDTLARQPTRSSTLPASMPNQQTPYTNGNGNVNGSHYPTPAASSSASAPSSSQVVRRQSAVPSPQAQQLQLQGVLRDPHSESIDPTAETYIKVGDHAYKVNPSQDPQEQTPGPSGIRQSVVSQTKQNGGVDPLKKQLEELQNAVSNSGSVRRNTIHRSKPSLSTDPKPGHTSSSSISSRTGTATTAAGTSSSLSLPAGSSMTGASGSQSRTPSPARDYRNSAESVVGAHPSVSRPTSPNPPTAAFMVPRSVSPVGAEKVQEVLSDYAQSLPGERKSISRSNSRGRAPSISQGSILAPSQASHGQNLARPPSQVGHAGIGAHGSRSNSPQPLSRGPSPAPGQVRTSFIQPPSQAGPGVARAPSPNTVGIALDPSGRVLHDELAQQYQQRQQQQQPPQHTPMQMHQPVQQQRTVPPPQTQQPAYNPPPPPVQQQIPAQHVQQPQRRNSFVAPLAPPVQPQVYAVTPPPQAMYQTPSPQPSYIPPPPVQSVYNPPPPPQPVMYQQQPIQQPTRYVQQQPSPVNTYNNGSLNGLQRNSSSLAYYGNQTPPQQQQVQPVQVQQARQQTLAMQQQPQQQQFVQNQQPVQQQQQQRGYQQQTYRDPSPVGRSPSPQPPLQTTDGGDNVLFYGKTYQFLECRKAFSNPPPFF